MMDGRNGRRSSKDGDTMTMASSAPSRRGDTSGKETTILASPSGSNTKLTKKISDISAMAAKKVTSPVIHTMEKLHIKSSSSTVAAAAASNGDIGTAGRSAANGSANSQHVEKPAPPDCEILSKMNVLLKRKLRGISIQDYYRTIWSEGDGIEPFYAPWLENCGKFNINVGSWEESTGEIVNPWDGECYDRQRIVTFTTKRSGIGPSTADAAQTQRCRVEGNDRCIVSLTINMKVPFGDCFSVEVRWVVSRIAGSRDLSASCGMVINFSKSCFVEGKIRANTTVETQKGQTNLFDNMKRVCRSIAQSAEAYVQDEEEEEESKVDIQNDGKQQSWLETMWSIFLLLSGWRLISYFFESLFAFFKRQKLNEGKQNIAQGIREAHRKLDKVHNMLRDDSIDPKEVDRMRLVIPIVNDALGKLIVKAEAAKKVN